MIASRALRPSPAASRTGWRCLCKRLRAVRRPECRTGGDKGEADNSRSAVASELPWAGSAGVWLLLDA
jgi:hypothetical protein